MALFDIGADLNCIRQNLVPDIFYENVTESLRSASGDKLQSKYKLSKVEIKNQNVSYKTDFLLIEKFET